MATLVGDCQSRYGHWLAAEGISFILDMEESQGQCGRPAVAKEIRQLIRRMSRENPLWGAPKIHGELLKLGIDISVSTVSKYLGATPRIAFAELENISREPPERHGFCGLLYGSDDPVSDSLCLPGVGT